MSFPRAKLQRFNELNPCTPSPADYNVQTKVKPKCTVIPQSERFLVLKSPTVSENGSVKSTPCFRTPTLPKGKRPKPAATTTPKQLFETPINHYIESLNEKIVECENKDQFIKELTEQMEELKQQMVTLETNFRHVEHIQYEQQLGDVTKEFEESKLALITEHQQKLETINNEKQKLADDLNQLKTKYNELLLIDDAIRTDLQNKEIELKALEQECVLMQERHATIIEDMEKKHMHEMQDIEFEMLKTMTELEKEKQNAANKILDIEQCMQEEIARLIASFHKEKEQLIAENDSRVIELKRETATIETELTSKMDQLEIEFKLKMENREKESEQILKECQAISEYNIIQCELEKKQIESSFAEKSKEADDLREKYATFTCSYADLQDKYKQIQKDYSELVIELNDVRQELSEAINEKEKEIKKLLAEKRTFQITITTTQDTIEVLKRRLISSDTDVEQLKEELTRSEEKMLEYETKHMEMMNELHMQQLLYDELEIQYECTVKMNEEEILDVKEELTGKVNEYKKQVENYTKKLQMEQELFNELLGQLHEQKEVNHDAFKLINVVKGEIEQLQEEVQEYETKEQQWTYSEEELKREKSELETQLAAKEDTLFNMLKQINQLQEKCDSYCQHFEYYKGKVMECEKEIEEADNIHKKYIDQSGKYDNLLQKYEQLENEREQFRRELEEAKREVSQAGKLKLDYEEVSKKYKKLSSENETNKKKIQDQKNFMSPFKRQLEEYELEREKLIVEKSLSEIEAREMSKKYADLVGHQNNKQKIKHVVDIKLKNEELLQCKMDLEAKLRSQSKLIEKLRNENSDLKRGSRKFGKAFNVDDKENISSPNRSLNNSLKIDSPGPLKERN